MKGKQPEMTRGYPIFEWSPKIPIMEKYNNKRLLVIKSNYEVKSLNISEDKYNITEY